jgi:aryl-alcohol dehydrogenase-like predicted oxidoreductase
MLRRRIHPSLPPVSALGLGGGPLGDLGLDDGAADRLLRRAFELGIDLVDTAPSYGASEERIGRVLARLGGAERDRLVVVTKGGYGVPSVGDWTPEVLSRGIDQALRRLATDRIDVFVLHSCPRARLEPGDLLPPLLRAKQAGKVRAVGYSGDGDALAWAARCDVFDVLECSVNLVDQEALARAIPEAVARDAGILAKRAMAGAPWEDPRSAYVDRWRVAFAQPIDGTPPDELAVRFAAHAAGVTSALVGTRRIERVEQLVAAVAKGPLPADVDAEIRRRFSEHGSSGRWPGVI